MTNSEIASIEEKIGYEFKNKALLSQAFTCPSVSKQSGKRIQNYQILEFLGDSVLSVAVSKILCEKFCSKDCFNQLISEETEGSLSVKKTAFVKNNTLAICSKTLGLDDFLDCSNKFAKSDKKDKKGDLIESILGAVAVDCDWNLEILTSIVKKLVFIRNFDEEIAEKKLSDKKVKKNLFDSLTIDNAKSVLNNLIQQKKISTPIFEITEINKDKRKLWQCKATLQKENITFTAICPRKNRAMQESIFSTSKIPWRQNRKSCDKRIRNDEIH